MCCNSTIARIGTESAADGNNAENQGTATLQYVDYTTNGSIAQLEIKLYWNIVSQPSRAIKSLLVAGGIPH